MADDLEIPSFLKTTKADAAERRKAWEGRPVTVVAQFAPVAMPNPNTETMSDETRAMLDAAAERKKIKKHNNLHAMLVNKAQHYVPGMVWNNGRYEFPGSMSRANYDRIMAELPTASMKKIFADGWANKVRGKEKVAA